MVMGCREFEISYLDIIVGIDMIFFYPALSFQFIKLRINIFSYISFQRSLLYKYRQDWKEVKEYYRHDYHEELHRDGIIYTIVLFSFVQNNLLVI